MSKGCHLHNADFCGEPQKGFKEIQTVGNVSEKEMYRTFNMGVGFCVVADDGDAEKVIEICKKHGTKAFKIGQVVREEGVNIDEKFVLKY